MKWRLRAVITVIPLALLLGSPAFSQTTGTLQGTVVDQSGAPLAGAEVLYQNIVPMRRDRMGRLIPGEGSIHASVLTGSRGEFTIARFPAGEYYLCALGPAAGHLKSCGWGGRYAPARVQAGATAAPLTLTVQTGTLLRLSVDDAGARIASGARFVAGVFSAGGYYARFRPAGVSGTQVLYTLAVPSSGTFRLLLNTSLSATDSSGNSLVTTTGKPVLSITTAGQQELAISVIVK